jgi:hypothetical protein
MDATFGTNDVKYHFFTLMGIDAHHTRMRLAWIIIVATLGLQPK